MTPELWQRLKPLFDGALSTPREQRASFIADACGEDRELKEELAKLLNAHEDENSPIDSKLAHPYINVHDFFTTLTVPPVPGEMIADRFRIVRHLGSGGMGDVYEAEDILLKPGRIALKTIKPEIAQNPSILARFKEEVVLARRISGPNVCRIYELYLPAAEPGDAFGAFLTMEFLEGETLAERLEKNGPLSIKDTLALSLQLCEALRTIHHAGVIHRDLKPRNIMLVPQAGAGERVVVMDFGLARTLPNAAVDARTALTLPGGTMGTPAYMAPEQFEGREVSPATDIYSLGVVLYECLTGARPFAAPSALGSLIQRGKLPTIPSARRVGIPSVWDQVIHHSLEYEPDLRYQSVDEMERALRRRFLPSPTLKRLLQIGGGAFAVVVLLLSLLLIPAIGERVRGMLFASSEKHVAVLPLDVVGGTPETQALGDGLMDLLADKLSSLDVANKALWVIPASEVRSRKVNDSSSALKQFGATIVVKGRFERSDHAAHLTLTLIDTKKMREIGFADVRNQSGDLVSLENEAVLRLGRLMNLSVKENAAINGDQPTSRASYEDYLTGLGYFQRFDKPGNIELAAAAFESTIRTDPHFALAFARLAQVYMMKYRLDSNMEWLHSAEAYCRKAVELDSQIPLTYAVLARIHEVTGNHDLAIQEFQRALDLDPRDADAWAGIASAYHHAGRDKDAEAAFIKAAETRPNDWTGYNSLGNFYEYTGRPSQAIAQFLKALQLTPDNAGLYTNLGMTYLDLNDQKMEGEAEKALRKSIEINPTFEAYGNLGFLYAQEHRFAESVDASKKALEINNRSYEVWINLTASYEWMRETALANESREHAILLLEEAIRLNTQNTEAHAFLAALYAKNGLRDKASTEIHISLALSPADQYSLAQVAAAYELLGDRKDAIRYLEAALNNGLDRGQLREDPEIQGILSDPVFKLPPARPAIH
jgi:serine/threonine protein kinase/tetratricopeptide (TPR) repeat protein